MAEQNQEMVVSRDMPLTVKLLREDLGRMEDQFRFALPAHIPTERFIRVVMTAVQNNTKLLKCTKQSFFNACMRAAQDGLLPDGREGAIVPYGEDEDGKGKSDVAQWMPMIKGIRKLVRNAGVLVDWNVQVVQQGDEFDYQLGDDPFIKHKPAATGGRQRPVLFAYSIATYPDGSKSREVMNIDQIKDIQAKSKAKRGPWSDPTFFPEMARKTVARLHSKQLPMSTDLDRVLHRDDELYDFKSARDRREPVTPAPRPASISAALDAFGNNATTDDDDTPSAPQASAVDANATPAADLQEDGGGESAEGNPVTEASASAAATANSSSAATVDPIATAYRRGQQAKAANHRRTALPGEYRDDARVKEHDAWLAGWDGKPPPSGSLV